MAESSSIQHPDSDKYGEIISLSEQELGSLFSLTNSKLVLLFWNIGKVISEGSDSLNDMKIADMLSSLSMKLESMFGSLFNHHNLQVAAWYYHLYKDPARLNTVAIKQTWAEISKAYPNPPTTAVKKSPTIHKTAQNPFRGQEGILLQQLLNPDHLEYVHTEHHTQSITEIVTLITAFQTAHTQWLVHMQNLFFWKIGNYIHQVTHNKSDNYKNETIQNISTVLTNRFETEAFSNEQLEFMLLFFTLANDRASAIRISSLLTWEKILLLFRLFTKEEAIYWARQSAQKNWTVAELDEHITLHLATDSFKHLIEKEPQPEPPSKNIIKKKHGNSEIRITEFFYQTDTDIIQTNGFVLNPYHSKAFVQLIKARIS